MGWVGGSIPYLWTGSNNRHLDSGGRLHCGRIHLRHRSQSHPRRLPPRTHISACSDWCTTLHQTGINQQLFTGVCVCVCVRKALRNNAGGEEFPSIHLVFFAVLVHAATMSDWHAHPALLHKPVIACTSWFTGLIVVAVWGGI